MCTHANNLEMKKTKWTKKKGKKIAHFANFEVTGWSRLCLFICNCFCLLSLSWLGWSSGMHFHTMSLFRQLISCSGTDVVLLICITNYTLQPCGAFFTLTLCIYRALVPTCEVVWEYTSFFSFSKKLIIQTFKNVLIKQYCLYKLVCPFSPILLSRLPPLIHVKLTLLFSLCVPLSHNTPFLWFLMYILGTPFPPWLHHWS